jgi:hypothetical protein
MATDATTKDDVLGFETISLQDLCTSNLFAGEALFPGDPRFQGASKQWNAVFDSKSPTAIVYCNHAKDVSLLVKWIASKPQERKFSVRSSGHGWNGVSVLDGGIVMDLSRLNGITVEDNRFARVGPGLEQGWANRAMKPYGKMFPTSGDGNQFGYGGFLHSGGFSLWARGKGLAADYVVEATVVLMDGTIVVAKEDDEQYMELWWGLRGGGAGNFGIVTEMLLDTFDVSHNVLSIEAWWTLPEDPVDTARLLQTWAKYHKGDINPELGLWLFLFPGEEACEFKLGGVWDGGGQDIQKGWELWNNFKNEVGLPLLDKTSVLELNPHDAVDVHQLTCAGRDFFGAIESRKADKEWTDDVMMRIAVEMKKGKEDPKAGYMHMFFPHGGAVESMDPKNERSAYGKRDSPGDMILLVVQKGSHQDLPYYEEKLRDYQKRVFDPLFSKNCYPGHTLSIEAVADLPNRYYDYDSKPWLYDKLQALKAEYDPENLLQSLITIPPKDSKVDLCSSEISVA